MKYGWHRYREKWVTPLKYMKKGAKDTGHGVSTYSILGKDWGETYVNAICHSDMNDDEYRNSEWVVTWVWKDDSPHSFKWIAYLFNKYREHIGNPTIKSVFTEGLWLDSKTPSNKMMFIITVCRYLWEETHKVELWHRLTRQGVDKDIAFCLIHLVNADTCGEGKENNAWNWKPSNNGHAVLQGYHMNMTYLRNYKEDREVHPNKPYSDNVYYRGVMLLYWEGDSMDTWANLPVQDIILESDNFKSERRYVYTNPWDDTTSVTHYASLMDTVRQLTILGKQIKQELSDL